MANCKLPCAMLYGWFKCKLKPPKNVVLNFQRPVAPPYVFWIGKQIGP